MWTSAQSRDPKTNDRTIIPTELLAHFGEEDYKDKYAYNYNKEYFKDKLVGNFSVINFNIINFALGL